MPALNDANMLLNKHYNITISIDGLQETIEEMLTAEETSPDEMLKMVNLALQWSKYLDEAKSVVDYYLGFFEIKHSMIGAVKDEAKEDIRNDTRNSIPLAKKCKISEEEPEKILEASEWMLKTSKAEIRILKKYMNELNNYSKLMKAKYYSFGRKYRNSLRKVDKSEE